MKLKTIFYIITMIIFSIYLFGCDMVDTNTHEHDYTRVEVTKTPTCVLKGNIRYYCECGSYLDEEVKPKGHVYETYNGKKPTCTTDGYNDYQVCVSCGYSTKVVIKALGHNLTYHKAKEATCTETGHNSYEECSRCNYTTYQEIAKIGHNYVTYKELLPTCTSLGHSQYEKCSHCGDTLNYQSYEKLGHDLIHHDSLDATCTEDGHNEYDSCSRCDYSTYQVISALGHDLTYYNKLDATCTENGHTKYEECSRCDYSTYQEIEALGHNYVTYNELLPTCTSLGHSQYEKCSQCGDTLNYISYDQLGHDLIHHYSLDATCLTTGHNEYDECSRCDYSTYQEIEALGHDLVIFNEVLPTCLTAGHNYHEYCQRCDYIIEEVIYEALGHDYIHYDELLPTCLLSGHSEYDHCQRCDYSTRIDYEALGHDYIEVQELLATCTEDGHNQHDICSRCDYTTIEVYPMLGHDLTHHEMEITTCTTSGHNAYDECTRCDYTTYEYYEALGHDYVNDLCSHCFYNQNMDSYAFTFELNETKTGYVLTSFNLNAYLNTYNYNHGEIELIIPDYYYNMEVVKIGNDVFWSNYAFNKIVLGKNIKEIGNNAFGYCGNVKELVFNEGLEIIGNNAFCGLVIETLTLPDSLQTINESAFSNNYSLTSIHIGKNVSYIAYNAFNYAQNLSYITVDENNETYDSRENCNCIIETATNKIIRGSNNSILLDGITIIGSYSFTSLNTLSEVIIPDSVIYIEYGAFENCTNISKFHIGANVESFNSSTFYNTSIKEITVSENNPYYYVQDNCLINTYNNLIYSVDGFIPSGVTVIDNYAISNNPDITEIIIPEGVQSLYNYCFYNLENLEYVYIPKTTTYISNDFVYNCNNIKTIEIDPENKKYDSRDNSNCVIETATNTIIRGISTTTIPETVTAINGWSFYNSQIESIVIPSNVKTIGDYAFYSCYNLKEVIIEEGVEEIRERAFNYCNVLTKVVIPGSIKTIQDYTFSYCYNLEEVIISEGVEEIEYCAFYWCTSLRKVVISDSVVSIGDMSFYYCNNLRQVVIGKNVTSIGSEAFYGTNRIIEVVNKSNLEITKGSSDFGGIGMYAMFITNGDSIITEENDFMQMEIDNVLYLIEYIGDKNTQEIVAPNEKQCVIMRNCFSDLQNVVKIILDTNVIEIQGYAFSGSYNKELHYLGTMEQFRQITLLYDWGYNTNSNYVICSDGEGYF